MAVRGCARKTHSRWPATEGRYTILYPLTIQTFTQPAVTAPYSVVGDEGKNRSIESWVQQFAQAPAAAALHPMQPALQMQQNQQPTAVPGSLMAPLPYYAGMPLAQVHHRLPPSPSPFSATSLSSHAGLKFSPVKRSRVSSHSILTHVCSPPPCLCLGSVSCTLSDVYAGCINQVFQGCRVQKPSAAHGLKLNTGTVMF